MKSFKSILFLFTICTLLACTVKNTEESPLEYLIKPSTISSTNSPAVILLHGYGSNEKDLFSFADQLPEKYTFISARAPQKLRKDSYAWYGIDLSKKPYKYNKEDQKNSEKLILDFIDLMIEKHDLNSKEIYLLGFSQGSIMSYTIALKHPEKVKGIMALGGRIPEEATSNLASKEELKKVQVFIGHGKKDPVISVEDARSANRKLTELGITTTYVERPNMGHSIDAVILNELINWLN